MKTFLIRWVNLALHRLLRTSFVLCCDRRKCCHFYLDNGVIEKSGMCRRRWSSDQLLFFSSRKASLPQHFGGYVEPGFELVEHAFRCEDDVEINTTMAKL